MTKTISLVKLAGALALGLFLSNAAQAGLITGLVAFSGSVTLGDNGVADANLATVNEALNYAGVTVGYGTQTGAFASLTDGQAVTMANPWFFNDSTPITNFWKVGNFSFDLSYSNVITQTGSFLNVTGFGTLHDTADGYDATNGIWSFTIPSSGFGTAHFTFASSTSAIPDGGTTVMLLGVGLLGIQVALSRRKKR